jgi:hypothetical protein
MLDEGANDAGRRLRAKRPLGSLFVAATSAGDPEHLLLDGIAALAQAAGEQLDALEQRNLDPIERVSAAQVAGNRLNEVPGTRVFGEHVARTAWRADLSGHVRSVSVLVLNGLRPSFTEDEFVELTMAVASGKTTKAEAAIAIASHIRDFTD